MSLRKYIDNDGVEQIFNTNGFRNFVDEEKIDKEAYFHLMNGCGPYIPSPGEIFKYAYTELMMAIFREDFPEYFAL